MLDSISRAGRANSQWLSDAVSALFEAAHLRRELRRLQHPTCTQERSGRENRNRSGARKVGASTVALAHSPATWKTSSTAQPIFVVGTPRCRLFILTPRLAYSRISYRRNPPEIVCYRDVHLADLFGAERSRLPPQELTQLLTCSCETPPPRSSEPIAFLTPATCHSFTSRYSRSASAARNERLRPVLLASFSRRFFTSVSTRSVNVVEAIGSSHVVVCTHPNTGKFQFSRLSLSQKYSPKFNAPLHTYAECSMTDTRMLDRRTAEFDVGDSSLRR